MQTFKEGFEEHNLAIARDAKKLEQYWRIRLAKECPEQPATTRKSIVRWLLKRDLKQFELLEPKELEIAEQVMEYRWKILRQRYLEIGKERAYRNLLVRLGSLFSLCNKIQTSVALSRDRQRSVMDALQKFIQYLLQNDIYMQQQMARIAEFTTDRQLQNTLLLASIEEYLFQPVHNQPLLVHYFANYLRRTQRGGLTQIPGS